MEKKTTTYIRLRQNQMDSYCGFCGIGFGKETKGNARSVLIRPFSDRRRAKGRTAQTDTQTKETERNMTSNTEYDTDKTPPSLFL